MNLELYMSHGIGFMILFLIRSKISPQRFKYQINIKFLSLCIDTKLIRLDNTPLVLGEGYSSGQRGQTVNLLAMPT